MTRQEVLVNRKMHHVRVLERDGNSFTVEVNRKTVKVRIPFPSVMVINGRSFKTEIEKSQKGILQVKINGEIFETERQPRVDRDTPTQPQPISATPRKLPRTPTIEKDVVTAPIAGRIVSLRLSIGNRIKKGDRICILEAMKMENEIFAPKTGVIKEIRVLEGTIVNKGDTLVVIT